jgi:hypothetical protein
MTASLATLLLVAAARAQEAAPAAQETPAAPAKPGFEAFVPQEALLFVGVDDVTALQKDWEASAWGRMFADPGAEPVRAAFKALLAAFGEQSKQELGIDVAETASLLAGRFGLELSGRPGDGDPKPGGIGADFGAMHGLVAVDAGEHAGELKERVARCFNDLVEHELAVMKLESASDVDFVTVAPKDRRTRRGSTSRRSGRRSRSASRTSARRSATTSTASSRR